MCVCVCVCVIFLFVWGFLLLLFFVFLVLCEFFFLCCCCYCLISFVQLSKCHSMSDTVIFKAPCACAGCHKFGSTMCQFLKSARLHISSNFIEELMCRRDLRDSPQPASQHAPTRHHSSDCWFHPAVHNHFLSANSISLTEWPG